MTNEAYFPPEAKAYKAFLDWLDAGKKVLELFDQSGVAVPPTLKHAILENVDQADGSSSKPRPSTVRAPDRPESPPQAKDGWLWIDAGDAMVRTVFLAVLNEGIPLTIKALADRVQTFLPNANRGSIYNNAAQLKGRSIQKTGKAWSLIPNIQAPILFNGRIWAPKEILSEQDLAAFRRMAVRHLLGISKDGLQVMQAFRQLEGADWLHAQLSKDLIKADLLVMKKEKKSASNGKFKKMDTRLILPCNPGREVSMKIPGSRPAVVAAVNRLNKSA